MCGAQLSFPGPAARGAVLAAPVHGDLGRVQIDRHRLGEVTTERPVKPLARVSHRPLDALAVHPAKRFDSCNAAGAEGTSRTARNAAPAVSARWSSK
jgi:hypothetical protein